MCEVLDPLAFGRKKALVWVSQDEVKPHHPVLDFRPLVPPAITVVGLTQGAVERPRQEVVELHVLPPRRAVRVLKVERLLHQLRNASSVFAAEELRCLAAQEVAAVKRHPRQERGFSGRVSEPSQRLFGDLERKSGGFHRDKIATVMPRSSSTWESLPADPSAA